MACKNICKLCERLILTQSVASGANLVFNLPADAFINGEKYCIVIAQAIPATATVNAPVLFTIGDGATAFPLQTCDGVAVVAQDIRSRTKYSTRLVTTATGGAFRLLGTLCNKAQNQLAAIDENT